VSEQELLRFTYFAENEKILSKKMFYVDSQRELVVTQLKEMKKLLQSFIQRKYKNCITKIGFSSEKELFNIFNKMFQNNKGFFSNLTVRTILSCFWQSIQEIFFQIRLK
jgi:predicted lipase